VLLKKCLGAQEGVEKSTLGVILMWNQAALFAARGTFFPTRELQRSPGQFQFQDGFLDC
jgi:hypothetical protein